MLLAELYNPLDQQLVEKRKLYFKYKTSYNNISLDSVKKDYLFYQKTYKSFHISSIPISTPRRNE
ncbi:hypothetical protein SAMN05216480_107169 [Pustulibacterium marinum]|uniref:Uncharacterized protein n=1 Tax=Pustulibacterium marinum TaxID=1224947 RepID=A0A1I7H7N1_9FLAO|nr:hypothetical protein SAMN05216480_107169 [Pustulibacterium marinum]